MRLKNYHSLTDNFLIKNAVLFFSFQNKEEKFYAINIQAVDHRQILIILHENGDKLPEKSFSKFKEEL